MKPYRHHVFICEGKRCSSKGSEAVVDAFKSGVKSAGIKDIKVTRCGCMKVCSETDDEAEFCPAVVVYPQGVWYKNVGVKDAEEIISSHLRDDKPVERLVLFKLKG